MRALSTVDLWFGGQAYAKLPPPVGQFRNAAAERKNVQPAFAEGYRGIAQHVILNLTHSRRAYRGQSSLCCATSLLGIDLLSGITTPGVQPKPSHSYFLVLHEQSA